MPSKPTLTQAVQKALEKHMMLDPMELVKAAGSQSAAIRQLNADGVATADISKVFNISYQEVRGLLSRPLAGETLEETQARIERGKKVEDARGNFDVQNVKPPAKP